MVDTITLATLLLGFGAFTKELYIPRAQFKGTADTDGTAALLKDTELNVFANDYFNEVYWVYITDGGAGGGGAGNIRNIADFTQVGGIVDPDIDFSGIPKIGATYQIWKCHVQDVIDALTDALVSIVNRPDSRGRKYKLYKKIVFESLGYDTLNANVAIGATSVVLANDASRFYAGQVCTIGDTAGSETITLLTVTPSTNTVTFAAITGAYTTAKTAYLVAQSGKYFNLGATIGNARVIGVFIRADSTSKRKIRTDYEIIQSLAGDRQIYFPDHSISVDDQTWVIEAMDKLETVDADTPSGTVTIPSGKEVLVYAETAYHYYRRQASQVSSGDWDRLWSLSLAYKSMVDTDLKGLWMPLPVEFADISTDSD